MIILEIFGFFIIAEIGVNENRNKSQLEALATTVILNEVKDLG